MFNVKIFIYIGVITLLSSCGGGGGSKESPYIPPANVPVSSVSISVSSKELVIGQTFQLTATVSPSNATDKSITWSSSNASVASVTPTGLVTAKAEGTATVKATCGGKTATCSISVKKPVVAVTSIVLDQNDVTLKEGETITLKATITPDNATDKTVTWGSSKTDIATVNSNGKVIAVKEGVCSITATCGDKTASCKVTVAKATVPVESITLSQTSLTLTEGDSQTITATVTPSNATDKTVTWSSSNSSVASVSNGTITAKSEGTATITASCGGKSATCSVTVKKKVIAVTSITLSETTLTLNVGNSYSLTATILPANATDKTITWSSSKPSVASVTNGTITALAVGTTNITASCGGKTATCILTVKNADDPPTMGIDIGDWDDGGDVNGDAD